MNQEYFMNQIKKLRENYLETVKKIVSIEEEIEKTVFYLQNLDAENKEKMFNMYKDYLNNLNSLRDELSSLMKDNLSTTQSFLQRMNPAKSSTTFDHLTEIYSNVVKFFLDCYNPFFWFEGNEKKHKGLSK